MVAPLVERTFAGGTYRGRMFPEYATGFVTGGALRAPVGGWSDTDSFWPLKDDLVRMMLDAGFESVEKIELGAGERPWQVDPVNRVMYVAHVMS